MLYRVRASRLDETPIKIPFFFLAENSGLYSTIGWEVKELRALCYVLKSLREQLLRGLRESLGDPVCVFLCDSLVGTVPVSFGLQTGVLIFL